jgi:hypothetical protein
MIEREISGGQTGADQAAWRAAKAVGIPTGGWMPRGFLTEDGPCPKFAELYGAVETLSATYPPRTQKNVEDSDATVWFGEVDTPGAMATLYAGTITGKPFEPVIPGSTRPSQLAAWIIEHDVRTLNVAGNRESRSPGIGAKVERFLAEVFRQLRETEGQPPALP